MSRPKADGPQPRSSLGAARSNAEDAGGSERWHLRGWLGDGGVEPPPQVDAAWSHVDRAAELWSSGDRAGALAEVDRFIGAKPQAAAGYALKAMLEPEAGAAENLEKALARGGEGWIYALRASHRSRAGDMTGARKDIDRALITEKGPWARLERAAILNRTGAYEEALEDIKLVRRALPKSPEPHLLAADIHLDQARYRRAAECLTRVIELDPKAALVYRKRARVFMVEGRLAAAQADLEKTCRLCPEDQYLRQDLIQLMIIRDRFDQAEAAMDCAALPPAARAFCLGYMRCRQRRYDEARRLFKESLSLQKPGDLLRDKAEFYAGVARILGEGPAPAVRPGKELVVVGLGDRHPYQISVGALRALNTCEVFFSNLSDPKVSDFLGLFPIPSKVIVFRGTEKQADDSARTVMAGFKDVRRSAIVTRCLPVVYGRLAWKVSEQCRRARIRYTVPGAISLFDEFPCLTDRPWESALGLQVLELSGLNAGHRELPVVVYSPKRVEGAKSHARAIPPVYPPDHRCYILPGGGEDEFSAVPVPFSGLEAAVEAANPACILYIPACPEKR